MAKNTENLTPAMKQFHHFKEKYPDAILFFRMGDFYETFYEDARTCSKVLGLALTARHKNSANPVPLAGLPFHAVDGYLKKMIQAGYKVAVCEQVEDPKKAKGVVKRDVVRVVTAGTLTDEMLLDSSRENFLAAVSIGPKTSAVSWVDISTGHFFVQCADSDKLIDELMKIAPSECLLPETSGELFDAETKKIAQMISGLCRAVVTKRPVWYFEPHSARQKLCRHFGVDTLEGFGIDDDYVGISAAGAIIEYINETQKQMLKHIGSIKKIEQGGFLQIDQNSLRSLEVVRTMRTESTKGTLLECIDKTVSPMGSRLMRSWVCFPLSDIGQINARHDAVSELCNDPARCQSFRDVLKNIFDIERIAARVAAFRASPKDLLCLGMTLGQVPELKELLGRSYTDIMKGLNGRCNPMIELAELLLSAIEPNCPAHMRDGGFIRSGFDSELDDLRSIAKDGKSWLGQYQSAQSELTGIANLKVGYNKVFGYYIEVSHTNSDKVPANYVRKQTIKNAERYITDELKKYEQKVLGADEKAVEIEHRIFEKLRSQTQKYIPRLQALAEVIAELDCLACFGYIAKVRNYIHPEMTEDKVLSIQDGKHPALAMSIGAEFVPNDTHFSAEDGDVKIVTGPNMSGKSTYIRQSALLVLMAQAGSFIPAKSAVIGIVDKIFTRVGASDELLRGRSTFMVEMIETANILNNATERSLVVLDEVGRGTSTYDGLSLAWAVTEHIANKIKCRTLFATHYHELTELADMLVNVSNINVAVREWQDEVVFLHKIIPGRADKSYGIHVAKIAGLPSQIIKRSSEILTELESSFTQEAKDGGLGRNKTVNEDEMLFVNKHKPVLDKLKGIDLNNLTPIEAINLLSQIQKDID